jgi:hypothetical protein
MEQQKQPKLEDYINVLINSIELAQKRGAYTLQESSLIYNSIIKMKETLEKKENPIIEKDDNKNTIKV